MPSKTWPGGRDCKHWSACRLYGAWSLSGPSKILNLPELHQTGAYGRADKRVPCTGHATAEGIDVLTANDKELRIELKRRISDRLHTSLMGANQADPVRYSSGGYKARHYNKRFGAELGAAWPHTLYLLCWQHVHTAHLTGLCMLRFSM